MKVAILATASSSVVAELRTNENDYVSVLVRIAQRLATLNSADQKVTMPESEKERRSHAEVSPARAAKTRLGRERQARQMFLEPVGNQLSFT